MKVFGKSAGYVAVACLSLLLLGFAPAASAGPVTMNITNANCGLSCGIVPANTVLGTVTMNLNLNGSVTVTVLVNPAYTFIVPDGNDINFKLGNSTSSNVSVSSFFQSNSGAPGTFNVPLVFSSLNGGTNVGGGLGTYAVTLFHVQDPNKPQQPLDYLTFTLTNSSGSYTMADLTNAAWAFHLGTCPQPTQGCNATTTGFVGTGLGTPSTVPEPGTATLAIFGTGLLFLSRFARRRFKRLSAV
ncbi:MAG TPA: PEP-CTERM sorting domain-containing protein [Candidatus Sulfotelmatobacter sp.]|jgi:hypothetical protein|nr:PEP-CTERM sorting domain-containing protein [Candidatus Sulfotelmatobacter sp.]